MVPHRHASPASSAELQSAYRKNDHVPVAAVESYIQQRTNISTTPDFKMRNAHSFTNQYCLEVEKR
jgi:hypothetical protein